MYRARDAAKSTTTPGRVGNWELGREGGMVGDGKHAAASGRECNKKGKLDVTFPPKTENPVLPAVATTEVNHDRPDR